MKTLDKTRPYGQVFGTADHAFEQDGLLFDMAGRQVGGETKAPADKPPASESVIVVDGKPVDLADMDRAALVALANDKFGLGLHPATGVARSTKAILEAAAKAKADGDQVASQLQG